MVIRRYLVFLVLLVGLVNTTVAQSVCSGKVSGVGKKPLPVAHVVLLTPDRISVVELVQTAIDGTFRLTIPHPGLWVLRFTGVGYTMEEIAIYVGGKEPVSLDVALGGYKYLPGEQPLAVLGDFNLWSIPNAVPLEKTKAGTFQAEIPTSKDSIRLRVRGYRDGDGVEGIRDAAYVLNREGGYDALIKAIDGKAKVTIELGLLDRSGAAAKVVVAKGSEQARRIASATQVWWEGERAYFAEQLVAGMDRERLDKSAPTWPTFVGRLRRNAEVERDPLVRAVKSLAYVSAEMRSRKRDVVSLTRCMKHIPPLSPAWTLRPNELSYAVRSTSWSDVERDEYLQTVIQRHTDRTVRAATIGNEYMILFNSDKDKEARMYYDILAKDYSDLALVKDILKAHPRPDPDNSEK
jgi:hypothetical protein